MKYLIQHQDNLDQLIAEKLKDGFKRFDIRSEFLDSTSRSETKVYFAQKPELFISVGSVMDRSLFRRAKEDGFKTCLIDQSIKRKWQLSSSSKKHIDLIFADLPGNSTGFFYGNPILDIVKSTSSTTEESRSESVVVGLITGFERKNTLNTAAIIKSISRNLDVEVVHIDLILDFEAALVKITNCNAGIATSETAELVCVALNCPSVRLHRKELFKKKPSGLLNSLMRKEVIQNINYRNSTGTLEEVNRILNDYNYCAGILQDYQIAKELLGLEPASRKIASKIVDWLEA